MTALSDLLNSHLPDGWSGKRLAEEAQARGHTLNRATAADYLRGKHAAVPGEVTLRAFEDALGIPIDNLRAAANVPRGEREPWNPPAESARLSQRQRAALDELIKSMAVGLERVDTANGPGNKPVRPLRSAGRGPAAAEERAARAGRLGPTDPSLDRQGRIEDLSQADE